jgi:hypothetical protein
LDVLPSFIVSSEKVDTKLKRRIPSLQLATYRICADPRGCSAGVGASVTSALAIASGLRSTVPMRPFAGLRIAKRIIELNRAVAISMAQGPQAGLDIVDTLTNEPTLKTYHLLPSVRGDLLTKLNRLDEARAEFERAASLTRNARERDLLLKRAKDCAKPLPTE